MEVELRKEIHKWTKNIKEERKKIELVDSDKKDFLKNIDAYISDSAYFLEKGKLIESFEALIWAWAYVTIGKEMGILKAVKK